MCIFFYKFRIIFCNFSLIWCESGQAHFEKRQFHLTGNQIGFIQPWGPGVTEKKYKDMIFCTFSNLLMPKMPFLAQSLQRFYRISLTTEFLRSKLPQIANFQIISKSARLNLKFCIFCTTFPRPPILVSPQQWEGKWKAWMCRVQRSTMFHTRGCSCVIARQPCFRRTHFISPWTSRVFATRCPCVPQ